MEEYGDVRCTMMKDSLTLKQKEDGLYSHTMMDYSLFIYIWAELFIFEDFEGK